MRVILDSLGVLMLVGVLAGMAMHFRQEKDTQQRLELARSETERFRSQIMLRTALGEVELTQRGYPATIQPEWFPARLPHNPLLPEGHPWVEIAETTNIDLQHPRRRIASNREVAQFWYNPHTGIVRARAPGDVSDARALRLYNYINDTELSNIFARER